MEQVIERLETKPLFPRLAPWEVERFRLWSLADMKPFETGRVAAAIALIGEASGIAAVRGVSEEQIVRVAENMASQLRAKNVHTNVDYKNMEAMNDLVYPEITSRLDQAQIILREGMLPSRLAQKLELLREGLTNKGKDGLTVAVCMVLRARLDDLVFDINTALHEPMFLYIGAEDRRFYEQPQPLFGPDVDVKFPLARRDISAAGRCLALDESTACVFHCMRVLELGLHVFAGAVGGVSFPAAIELENWKNIIDKIEAEIRKIEQEPKSEEKTRKAASFSQAAIQFRYFKDAWRNHVSHARQSYDEREAESVWIHVRDFMKKIAEIVPFPSVGGPADPNALPYPVSP